MTNILEFIEKNWSWTIPSIIGSIFIFITKYKYEAKKLSNGRINLIDYKQTFGAKLLMDIGFFLDIILLIIYGFIFSLFIQFILDKIIMSYFHFNSTLLHPIAFFMFSYSFSLFFIIITMYYGYLIDTTYYYVNNEEKWNLVLTSKDNYFFEKDDSKTSKTSKQESSKQESSKSNIFSFFKREEPYINDVQVFTKDNETKNILSYKSSSDIITNKNPFLTSLAILVILSSLIFSVYNVINYKNQNNKSLYTRINKKNYKKTLTLVNKDGKVKLKSFKIYKNKYNEIEHILNETPNKDNYFKFMKIKNKNKVGKDNKKYSYTAWQINEDKIPSTVKKYYKSKEKNKKKILKTNSKHKYNTNNKLNKDVDDLINAINKDINKDINKYIY